MKSLIVLALSLVSVTSFACPNLSGNFVCKDFENGLDQAVTITQAAIPGGASYQIKIITSAGTQMRNYIADGLPKAADRPEFASRTERSFCAPDNTLKVEVKGTHKNGELLNALITVGINAQGNLYDSYIGKQGAKDLKFEEVCLRK